jgi:hypothetical protein
MVADKAVGVDRFIAALIAAPFATTTPAAAP